MGRKGGETVADEGQKNVSLLDLQRVLYLLHGLSRQAALPGDLPDCASILESFDGLGVFRQELLVRHRGPGGAARLECPLFQGDAAPGLKTVHDSRTLQLREGAEHRHHRLHRRIRLPVDDGVQPLGLEIDVDTGGREFVHDLEHLLEAAAQPGQLGHQEVLRPAAQQERPARGQLLAVPLRSGGLLLIDRDDLHSGGLCVPGEVRHLARRALAFPGRGDSGVYNGFTHLPL